MPETQSPIEPCFTALEIDLYDLIDRVDNPEALTQLRTLLVVCIHEIEKKQAESSHPEPEPETDYAESGECCPSCLAPKSQFRWNPETHCTYCSDCFYEWE